MNAQMLIAPRAIFSAVTQQLRLVGVRDISLAIHVISDAG